MNNGSPWQEGSRKTALLITLLLVSAFSQIDRILPFILAESIKQELGLSDTQLGLIAGLAFAICYSLASIPLARLSDTGYAKRVLVWSVMIWSIMTGLGGLATGFFTLALSRLGVALGEAGGTPASHALIGQKIHSRFLGRSIGLFSLGIPLGTILGFGLGGRAADTIGWRSALFIAGGLGVALTLLVLLFVDKDTVVRENKNTSDSFVTSGRKLLSNPAFLWLFIGANLLGFASAPFYAFTTPFLIRNYGLTASQAGISFGLLQGLMGIIGTLLGGRLFDRAVKHGSKRLLNPLAIVFCIASVTTSAALFSPKSWMCIVLLIPGMFSFPFALPQAFGAGHLVTGKGNQGLASGILMLGTGLLGSVLAPFLVGLISDAATAAKIDNGLGLGLLLVPVFSLLAGLACFTVSRRISTFLSEKAFQN